MSKHLKYIISGALLFFATMVFSQIVIERYGADIERNVASKGAIDTIVNTVEAALKTYDIAATFNGGTNGRVTQQSIQDFKVLFENNALVLNDLRGKSLSLINFSDYASYVFNYLRNGVKAKIMETELTSISKDGDSYQVSVLITKKMENGLTTKNREVVYEKPVDVELIVIYDIEEDDLTTAKILKIERYIPPKRERKLAVMPGVRVGIGKAIGVNTALPEMQFDGGSMPTFGVAVGYNISDYLLVSLGAFTGSTTLNLDENSTPQFDSENYDLGAKESGATKDNEPTNTNVPITNEFALSDVNESIEVEVIELPLSLRYYFDAREYQLSFFAEAGVVARQFSITSDQSASANYKRTAFSELSRGEGKGFGNFTFDHPDFAITSLAPIDTKITGPNIDESKLSIAPRIGGGVHYEILDGIGVELEADYTLGGSQILAPTMVDLTFDTETKEIANARGSFIESVKAKGVLGIQLRAHIAF